MQSVDDNAASLNRRINELESLFLHMQRSLHDLDEALLTQYKRFDGLERQLARLAARVEAIGETNVEIRRPEDEVPPHY